MSSARPAVRVSGIPRSEASSALAVDHWAFAMDLEGMPLEPVIETLDWDRLYGGFVPCPGGGERLAGIYSAFSLDCPLPGGTTVPAAGLTWVGVHPRDRRRGVLTAMVKHHLEDVRARRGEPFSLLFAAEPAIYGRFGYGLASTTVCLELSRGAQLRDVPGADDLVADLETADPDRQAETLAACFTAVAEGRPGCINRPTVATQRYVLHDPPTQRKGAENLRVLTVTAPDGELRGYALFRRRMRWEHGVPAGTVEVDEVMARDAAATHAIWSRLLDLDLTTRIVTPGLAPDDALLHLLVDLRAAAPRVQDALWLRLVDLPAALSARRYAAPIDVVLEVADTVQPANAGRWRVRGGSDGGTCTRTEDKPQLSLDVRELGSAYLGGTALTALAAAGLVTVHDPAALTATTTALTSPIAPWCAWSF